MILSDYKPISLPLRIKVDRNTYSLSNNNQRKWHYHEQANVKKVFEVTALFKMILARWKPIEDELFPIGIRYGYYLPPNGDFENYHALVSKYFQDAMELKGYIPKDTPEYIVESTVRYLGTRYKKDGEPEVIISLYKPEEGSR